MTATFMNAFYEPFAHAQKNPWVVHTPSVVECIALVFQSGKFGGWEGIQSCNHQSRLSQGRSIRDDLGPGRLVKGYNMASLQTCFLPHCSYAAIVLLEEKIVSNILIDWHDMCVKALILITLACKCTPNYYAN